MTASDARGSQSMHFQLHEVLSGMLASTSKNSFSDDVSRLTVMFERLAATVPLFAPMATGVDAQAVARALQTLETKAFLQHADGLYTLTDAGRAHCVSSKRMLFGQDDREQLEAAARVFDTL